ncbi:MAG: AraC family transcriptional regulator [Ruminococcaceae bacterium]|nr:AraC family transcriptional regulator [Oscillospiraceae bacterium]
MAQSRHRYEVSWNSLSSPEAYGDCLLYQVGRIHMHGGTKISEHTQLDYFELTIAAEGKGTVYTNGKAVPITAGDVYLSFAGDFHAIASDTRDPLKFDFITVDTKSPALRAALEGLVAEHHGADERLLRDKTLTRTASRILAEKMDPSPFGERLLSALIEELIILLLRGFEGKAPTAERERSEKEMLALRLMHYIDSHIYSIPSLRALAEMTGYTYNYLSNLFKDVTGVTLSHYYKERRLEAATLLLREGFSVTKTASLLGYSSIYAFSNAYKNRYGTCPCTAKNQNEGEKT